PPCTPKLRESDAVAEMSRSNHVPSKSLAESLNAVNSPMIATLRCTYARALAPSVGTAASVSASSPRPTLLTDARTLLYLTSPTTPTEPRSRATTSHWYPNLQTLQRTSAAATPVKVRPPKLMVCWSAEDSS